MTTETLLDGLITREGGFVDHPHDRGGPTNRGITARTLGEWRNLGRAATRKEVEDMSAAEARAIYRARYVRPFTSIPVDELRAQLVDFGVLAGPATAIRALQEVLGVPVDGILGDRTKTALHAKPWKLVANALIAARVKRFSDLAEKDAKQRTFLRGWVARAVQFYETGA